MKALLTLVCAVAGLLGQAPGFANRGAHYRLQAEDKIEVQYRYTPEYNATVAIQPDGYATLPFLGEVMLAGLTVTEATAAICAKAGERLNDPEITVLLKDYIKPYFVIAGEVARPGRVDLRGDVKLIEAIALGGGFKDSAKRTQVVLIRRGSDGMAEVRVYDARKLMSAKGVAEDVPIRPGDMVVVPRNAVSKIEPFFRLTEPSLYALIFRLM
jgi:polysaccharide export outer membrane protein